jgi:type IV secretion system protein VirB10
MGLFNHQDEESQLDAREDRIAARRQQIEDDEARLGLSRRFAAARERRRVNPFTIVVGVTVLALLAALAFGTQKKQKKEEPFQQVGMLKAPTIPDQAPPPPPPAAKPKGIDRLAEARMKSAIVIKGTDVNVASTPEATYAIGANGQALGAYNAVTQGATTAGAFGASTDAPTAVPPGVDPTMAAYLQAGRRPDGDPNVQFYNNVAGVGTVGVRAAQVQNMQYQILQGKFIDGVLETAIRSDLPGMIRAVVSMPIYSEHQRNVLLPAGSRLVGLYNSRIRKGQSEVFVIWKRAIRPDGVEIALDSPGTDALGRAGLGGETDHHFAQIFGVSALISIIGAGSSTAGVDKSDGDNSAATYRERLQDSFSRSSNTVLNQYATIPPTIHVDQGTKIKIFVNRDLDFSSVFAPATTSNEPAFVMVQ